MKILYTILTILCLCIFLSLLGIEIYVWFTYGNKSINETPLWALIFMFGGKK